MSDDQHTGEPPLTPRAKIWIERDGQYVFGLGLSNILKAIDKTGSIKAAAEHVGKSYRHVWSRVKDVERDFGIPLVETHVGGSGPQRSELTDEAKLLVREYDRLRQKVFRMVDRQFNKTLKSLRPIQIHDE
ncbi:winged helix-turn-helix domain-containing protein [Thalassoroseus pseudoceratinae]|uniref:winged helix-turn-helix domain-containing protein n=1 Tax=Thalassoroseus pseudoceratinae TaxID=2713176 RepID=UPI00141FCAB7|nr:LysR family transcriptional regulator [Thalassoroseus pseudoceratinae]